MQNLAASDSRNFERSWTDVVVLRPTARILDALMSRRIILEKFTGSIRPISSRCMVPVGMVLSKSCRNCQKGGLSLVVEVERESGRPLLVGKWGSHARHLEHGNRDQHESPHRHPLRHPLQHPLRRALGFLDQLGLPSPTGTVIP